MFLGGDEDVGVFTSRWLFILHVMACLFGVEGIVRWSGVPPNTIISPTNDLKPFYASKILMLCCLKAPGLKYFDRYLVASAKTV